MTEHEAFMKVNV